jgi:hypothetical protein
MSGTGVSEAQLAEWAGSRYPYKRLAAVIARWAQDQDRHAELPGNAFFAGNFDEGVSITPYKNAKRLLKDTGVLYLEGRRYLVR